MGRRHEQTFLRRRHINANRHRKRCSTSLIIKEMRIKTTMRYHHSHFWMTKIHNTRNKCWLRCEEKWILLHCWWECKMVQPLWKIVWQFLKTLKTGQPYSLVIAQVGIYLKNTGASGWLRQLSGWLVVLAQVMISWVVGLSPAPGSALSTESTWDSLPLPLLLVHMRALSHSPNL